MNSWNFKLIFLFFSVICLTGCISPKIETHVLPDGSISRTIQIVTSKHLGMLPHRGFGLPRGEKWKIDEGIKDDGKYYYEASGVFTNPKHMEWKYSEVTLQVERNFFATTYRYKEFFKGEPPAEEIEKSITSKNLEFSDNPKDFLKDFLKMWEETKRRWHVAKKEQLDKVKANYELQLPGKIISTNNVPFSGNIVKTTFSLGDVSEGLTVDVTSKQLGLSVRVIKWIIFLVLVVGIYFLIKMIYMRNIKRRLRLRLK